MRHVTAGAGACWGIGKAFLLVHGDGVVDLAADFCLAEVIAKGIPLT